MIFQSQLGASFGDDGLELRGDDGRGHGYWGDRVGVDVQGDHVGGGLLFLSGLFPQY